MLFRLHEFSHRHRAAERRGSRSPHTHGSGSFPPGLRSASGRLGLGRSVLPASASRFEKTQPRIRGSAVGIVWLLAELAGFKGLNTIPEKWYQSVGFAITVFFAVTGLYAISRGGRWERRLFGPVLVSAAILAGLLTFG